MFQNRRTLVILRLIAGLLAATGLLGNGLAMLLIALLVSPAAATAESRYFSEICTADGIVRLADLAARDSEDGGGHGDPLKHCPVCTAYAQLGAADLPVTLVAPLPQCCSAIHRVSPAGTLQASLPSDAQPRAPPAIA